MVQWYCVLAHAERNFFLVATLFSRSDHYALGSASGSINMDILYSRFAGQEKI